MTTDQAGTDSALVVGCLDHLNSEVVTTANLDFSSLTDEQKIVYADFFALGSGRGWVNISNECVIGIDHITSEVVISDSIDLDYDTMTVEDKAKVDAFISLANQQ